MMEHLDREKGLAGPPAPTRSKPLLKAAVKSVLLLSLFGGAGFFQYSSFKIPYLPTRSVAFTNEQQDAFEHKGKAWNPQCPVQAEPLEPALNFAPPEAFKDEAAERLAQAVRIPTVSYDDNGPIDKDVGSFILDVEAS